MTTYHIFFRNQYSEGNTDYTLYRAAPIVYVPGFPGNLELPVFSNSFHTRNVPTDGTWPIDISDVPYAFCGTSQNQELGPGDRIADSGYKLVKISPQGNGSTVNVYNNSGFPAFRPDVVYAAHPGTFEVVTGGDIADTAKFVAGHSVVDNDGRSRPQATFKIERTGNYYVKPSAKFYLGGFLSQPGTLVDYQGPQAEIDFDKFPGLSNAIVTRLPDGSYEVKIVAEAAFAMETATVESVSASNVQLTQLKHQAKLMSNLIDAALGISPAVSGEYICTAEWVNNPSAIQKIEIAVWVSRAMRAFGYTIKSVSTQQRLTLIVTRPDAVSVFVVLGHLIASSASLPSQLNTYLGPPKVRKASSGLELASQSESSESVLDVSRLPRPQWACSVQWTGGAPPVGQEEIITLLIVGMSRRGYVYMSKTNTEKELRIDFWHANPTSQQAAQADWQASYKELPLFLRLLATTPRVEPLFHTDQPQTNGAATNGAPAGILVPAVMETYVGMLQWLEGPNDETKADIIKQLVAVLQKRRYIVDQVSDLPALDRLMIVFSHTQPTSVEQARADWLAAFNSITGFQRNCIFGPVCEENKEFRGGPVPAQSRYVGSLGWLEGPGGEARKSIISQIKTTLQARGYNPGEAIDFPDFLVMPFSHDDPSSLEQAQADWVAAVQSINQFQRMYVSGPRCEIDKPVSTDQLILPPSRYMGRLEWLEGPNQQTKDDIVRQLKTSLEGSQNRPGEAINFEDFVIVPFSHRFPSSLDQAKREWLAAYDTIKGNQRMYITNPSCDEDGPVSTNPPAPVTTNGTAAAATAPEAPAAVTDSIGEAPPPLFTTQQASSRQADIEEKKRRALELLRREGLVDVPGFKLTDA